MARAKKDANLPATMKAEMEQAVANLADRIGSAGGDKLKVKGKKFGFPDGHQEDGPFNFVVIGLVSTNMYYAGRYDPQNPVPPVCWALGTEPKKLVSSANSPDRQNDESCNDCPQNVFGSGEGNAKACKNMRVLGVVAGDSNDPEDPILKLEVAPKGLRNFDNYVTKLAAKGIHPLAVITQIDFDANEDYPVLTFAAVGPNPNAELHWGRRAEAEEILLAEPDPTAFNNDNATTGRAASKKKTSKKTAKKTATKAGGRSAGSRRV